MGGNALKDKGSVRCNKDVFTRTRDDFFLRFAEITDNIGIKVRTEALRSYRQKMDFGDLDVLIERNFFKAFDRESIVRMLSESYGKEIPYVSNGPVLSVGLPLEVEGTYLQLDMISTPADEFDFTREYFAWNDAGNLIGRVAHKMGLRFGHDGIWLPLRDGNNLFANLLVTQDFDLALDFLGFDATRWHEGFDAIEDVYKFIAAGKRFNPDIFLLENRNHTARVRDRKRPVYMGFLKWIGEQENLNSFEFSSDKSVYLPEIMRSFPDIRAPYYNAIDSLEAKKRLKTKFNGDLVSAWTGLSGKDLGVFMKSFKEAHPDMENYELTQDDVRDMVLSHKENFK